MDTLAFTATVAGISEEYDTVVTGVATCDYTNYLMFQRGVEVGDADDWGVHVEFNDQINSGYNRIASCQITRTGIKVKFTEPIDPQKQFGNANIRLDLCDEEYLTLIKALRRIFRGFESLLSIA